MSQLKARCIDQVLTFENTPVITSGNVNYDSIMFDFCSAWDGFTKTAIFYRSEDEVYYQLLDRANTCVIPNEVIKEKGDVYIGVFGVSGETTITSQVLKYKVTRGAITEDLKPSDPTPDIYLQLISGYNHYDERLAYFEERFNGSVGDAEKLGGQLPSYYAPLSELAKYLPLDGSLTTNYNKVSDLNNFYSGIGLFTGSIANMPSNSHWIVIAGSAGSGTVIQIAFDLLQNSGAKQRYRDGTTWNGWVDLKANYVPLTGGTVDGNVTVGTNTETENFLRVRNSKHAIALMATTDGRVGLYSNKHGWITTLSLDGATNTFNGTATGNLPLTGGRIDGKINFRFADNGQGSIFKNNSTTADLGTVLRDTNASGENADLVVKANENKVVFGKTDGTAVELLHTGNMASNVLLKNADNYMTGTAHTPLSVDTTYTGSELVRIGFYQNKVAKGFLGIMNGEPTFTNPSYSHKTLHHDGNSSKVHVGTSAPDTSSVWIDTSE